VTSVVTVDVVGLGVAHSDLRVGDDVVVTVDVVGDEVVVTVANVGILVTGAGVGKGVGSSTEGGADGGEGLE